MARLFADENFPLPTVESLRILGHTVATMRDVGKADHSLPDDKISYSPRLKAWPF